MARRRNFVAVEKYSCGCELHNTQCRRFAIRGNVGLTCSFTSRKEGAHKGAQKLLSTITRKVLKIC
jgi:hypothetical protein